MSVSAYVLIQTEVGKATAVADALTGIDGVSSADLVAGPYDVIVCTEAPTTDEVGRLVVGRIQMIDGITRTTTCNVVHL